MNQKQKSIQIFERPYLLISQSLRLAIRFTIKVSNSYGSNRKKTYLLINKAICEIIFNKVFEY